MTALMSGLSSLPFKAAMAAVELSQWQPFRRTLRDPARTQSRLLRHIVDANAETVFGRKHGLARVSDY